MQNFETSLAVRDFSDTNSQTRRRKIGVAVVGVILLVAAGVAIGVYFGLKSSSSSSSSSDATPPSGGTTTFATGAKLNATFRDTLDVETILVRGANTLPSSIDWRSNPNAMTPIKNQQQCGCCWAFSTSDIVEAAYGLSTNTKVQPVSIQQIITCDSGNGDQGCNGGDPAQALSRYLSKNALTSAALYPFSGNDGNSGDCSSKAGRADPNNNWFPVQVDPSNSVVYAISPCRSSVCAGSTANEQALQAALLKGPVSICVDASDWNNYRGGVVDGSGSSAAGGVSCSNQPSAIDHAVAVVGYNTANGKDYWIVRNQWGTTWGDKGYIYLQRGLIDASDSSKGTRNTCCILCEAVQTNVKANIAPATTAAPVVIPSTAAPATKAPTVTPTKAPTIAGATTQTVPTTAKPTTQTVATTARPTTSSSGPVAPLCTNPVSLTTTDYACHVPLASISNIFTSYYQNNYGCATDSFLNGWCCYAPASWAAVSGTNPRIKMVVSGGKTVYASCQYPGAPPALPSSSSATDPTADISTTPAAAQTCSNVQLPDSVDGNCCAINSDGTPFGCIVQNCCWLASTGTTTTINSCTSVPSGVTPPSKYSC